MNVDDWLQARHAEYWPSASIEWATEAQKLAAMSYNIAQQCLRDGDVEMARWHQSQAAMQYSAAAKAMERARADVSNWHANKRNISAKTLFDMMDADNREIMEAFFDERANH